MDAAAAGVRRMLSTTTVRLRVARRRLLAAAAGMATLGAMPLVRAQAGGQREAGHEARREVQRERTSRRIVAIGGAITETLYALGAQDELVGVDTTSLYPHAATRLPSVGYARALSAEGLLSLRPTLVLASGEAGPPVVLRQLEAARVPLMVLDAEHSIEGVLARTRRIGGLTGRVAEGERLASGLSADWAATQRAVQSLRGEGPGPRVLFVLSHAMNQVRIGGRKTAADAVIGYAGGRNAFAGVEGFRPLTPEAAIAAAPDVILATAQGLEAAGGVDGLLKAPGLAATPAGRARRVVALEALFLLGFGPRLPQAVAELAQQLHGGAGMVNSGRAAATSGLDRPSPAVVASAIRP
jgi:iron complex transport system substrate-binding protein